MALENSKWCLHFWDSREHLDLHVAHQGRLQSQLSERVCSCLQATDVYRYCHFFADTGSRSHSCLQSSSLFAEPLICKCFQNFKLQCKIVMFENRRLIVEFVAVQDLQPSTEITVEGRAFPILDTNVPHKALCFWFCCLFAGMGNSKAMFRIGPEDMHIAMFREPMVH